LERGPAAAGGEAGPSPLKYGEGSRGRSRENAPPYSLNAGPSAFATNLLSRITVSLVPSG
jgi:hypothetical protein